MVVAVKESRIAMHDAKDRVKEAKRRIIELSRIEDSLLPSVLTVF